LGIPAEFLGFMDFKGIDTNQPYPLAISEEKHIAAGDSLEPASLGISSLREWEKR